MRKFLLILFTLFSIVGYSQSTDPNFTQPIGTTFGNQTVISMPYNAPGFALGQALVYLPPGYNDPANAHKFYPCLFFSPGSGETDQTNIIEVINTSIPQLISQGFVPYSIDTITHDTIPWIVISQHASGGAAFAYPNLLYTLPYLLSDTVFRIDTTCFWLAGLSNGCRATVSVLVGNNIGDTALGKRITGFFPISGAGYDNFQNSTHFANLDTIMRRGAKVLATIGDQDQNYNAVGYFQFDTAYAHWAIPPGFRGAYRHYVFAGVGHNAGVWNTCFQLNFKNLDSTQLKWNAWDLMWSMRKSQNITTLTVNAGTNQAISLPTTSVTLTATPTTPSGTTITGYQWVKLSGPSGNAITTPTTSQTTVTGLVQGVYKFKVTVTNSTAQQASDSTTITVNAAAANPPIVSAGSTQTITLPTTSATLSGSAIPQGTNTISSYKWTQVSGPNTAVISNSTSASTLISGLIQGIYTFRLKATDNIGQSDSASTSVTVNAAGAFSYKVTKVGITEYQAYWLYNDSSLRTFVYNQTSGHVEFMSYVLNGRKVIDVAPLFNRCTILDDQHFAWVNNSGTNTATRMSIDTTGATLNDVQSVYGYFFTGALLRSDGSIWYYGQDDYHFFSNGGINISEPIKLPQPAGVVFTKLALGNSFLGLASNGDVYEWTIGNTVYHKVPLPRKAVDIQSSHYDFQIAILPDPTGSQVMGYPYAWGSGSVFWGGNGSSIPYTAPIALKTLWNMTTPIKIIAVSQNTIHYIDSLGDLYGLGDNPQGEVGNGIELVNHAEKYPTPYAWSWVKAELLTGAPPIKIGQFTKWKNLWSGQAFSFYKYAQAVNDSLYFWGRNKSFVGGDGAVNNAEATYPNALDILVPTLRTPITIQPTQTIGYNFALPTAFAGNDTTITVNYDTLRGRSIAATLSASAKPNYGYTVTSYLWTQLSGPTTAIIANPTQISTAVTGMNTGTYTFKLLAADNNTGTIADTVRKIVNVDSLPVVNAGNDQVVSTNNTTVTGTATPMSGATITQVTWSFISGPVTPTITSIHSNSTTVTGMSLTGNYILRFTATDSNGKVNNDDIKVTVSSPNNVNYIIRLLHHKIKII